MIIEYKNLSEITNTLTGKKKVLVGGCFDILHWGHIVFLRNAARLGDFLIVALESDEFIKKHKKRQPVHSIDKRAEILDSLKFVDLVIKLPLLKGFDDYLNLVKTVSPSFIAITEGDPQTENKKKQAKIVGAKLVAVTKRIHPFSTNSIIKNETFYRHRSS